MLNLEKTISDVGGIQSGKCTHLGFLTPLLACAAASLVAQHRLAEIHFDGGAQTYAATIGLASLLDASAVHPPVGVGGATYSPLVELLRPETVDQCAGSILSLMLDWVPEQKRFVHALAQVLSEVMDNVPAHARGNGYAMAQVYPQSSVIEIAIADGGIGMLGNVRRVGIADIETDGDAIRWCLERGHSTVPQEDPWAQRGDWDGRGLADNIPIQVRSDGSVHAGLGLATLWKTVMRFGGEAIIWSGEAYAAIQHDQTRIMVAPNWRGVAIAVRLPVPQP